MGTKGHKNVVTETPFVHGEEQHRSERWEAHFGDSRPVPDDSRLVAEWSVIGAPLLTPRPRSL
jgi:hypothetical protein